MRTEQFSGWRKSSRSGNEGDCVEVAENVPTVVGVRDSKDPAGPVLMFSRSTFASFVTAVGSRTLS